MTDDTPTPTGDGGQPRETPDIDPQDHVREHDQEQAQEQAQRREQQGQSQHEPESRTQGQQRTREREDLIAELEVLREENERLRDSYVQATTTQYRRVAVGLVGLGLLATFGAALFPAVRTVLLALGATGLFSGLLTYYLTPERFVAADIGASVYATLATNWDSVVTELGLEDEHVYVPIGDATTRVKLFVPHKQAYTLPEAEALRSVFVVTDDAAERGVAVDPVGHGLFGEFERALDGPLSGSVPGLVEQLREGLVEQFEIAADVAFEIDDDRVIAELQGDVYGDVSRFDHPARSFLAVGLARGLERPVRVEHADGDTSTVAFYLDTATESHPSRG